MGKEKPKIRLGKKLINWSAPDYHPHERGLLWHIGFCGVMFGSAIFFLWWDKEWGWVSAFTFCFVAAVYFWIHRDAEREHEIEIFENALILDKRNIFPWDKFRGYWILDDIHARLLVFEYSVKRSDRVILQLEEISNSKIHKVLDKANIEELPKNSQKEALTDLWIRALKL